MLVTLCFFRSGHLHQNLCNIFKFKMFNFTLITASSDYNIPTIDFVIPAMSGVGNEACIDVSILDDDILEGTQSFSLFLTSENAQVDDGQSVVVISITDTNSKLHIPIRVISLINVPRLRCINIMLTWFCVYNCHDFLRITTFAIAV